MKGSEMKTKDITAYPRIEEIPEYQAEAEKLAAFKRHLIEANDKLEALNREWHDQNGLSDNGNAYDDQSIEVAERLIAGKATEPATQRIETAQRLIKALKAAITQQEVVERRVKFELSRHAAKDFEAEHKAAVRRLMNAVIEIHEANKAEIDVHNRFEQLGYSGSCIYPGCLNGVDDPSDKNGNRAYYWLKDARAYVLTDAEKKELAQAETEKLVAQARRKRLELINAN
jgi:hypothetical protein